MLKLMGFRQNFSSRRRHHVIAPVVLSLSRKHVDGWVTIISVVCSRNGEQIFRLENKAVKRTEQEMLQKNPDKRLNSLLPGPWLRLPNSVTSPLFSNFYIGLKSRNALNINVFLLPTKKLLPLLNYLSAQPDLCSAPRVRATRSVVTLSIFFSKNHQSLISLCITSSLESTSCLIPPA